MGQEQRVEHGPEHVDRVVVDRVGQDARRQQLRARRPPARPDQRAHEYRHGHEQGDQVVAAQQCHDRGGVAVQPRPPQPGRGRGRHQPGDHRGQHPGTRRGGCGSGERRPPWPVPGPRCGLRWFPGAGEEFHRCRTAPSASPTIARARAASARNRCPQGRAAAVPGFVVSVAAIAATSARALWTAWSRRTGPDGTLGARGRTQRTRSGPWPDQHLRTTSRMRDSVLGNARSSLWRDWAFSTLGDPRVHLAGLWVRHRDDGAVPGGVAGLPAHDGRPSSGHDRGVDSDAGSLQVELEDAGGTRWWKGLLATLSSQYGNAYLRFVGRVDGQVRYASSTFAVPRTWGDPAAGAVGAGDDRRSRGAVRCPGEGRLGRGRSGRPAVGLR